MLHMPFTPAPLESEDPMEILRHGVAAGEIVRVRNLLTDLAYRAMAEDNVDLLNAAYLALVYADQDTAAEIAAYAEAVDRVGVAMGWTL